MNAVIVGTALVCLLTGISYAEGSAFGVILGIVTLCAAWTTHAMAPGNVLDASTGEGRVGIIALVVATGTCIGLIAHVILLTLLG